MKNSPITLYEEPPMDFNSDLQVSGCYIEVDGKLLLLKTASHKPYANQWGLPAGKFQSNETPEACAYRELWEETGLQGHSLSPLKPIYVQRPDINFVFYQFQAKLERQPEVILSSEHIHFAWVTPQEAINLPLLIGAKEVLEWYYQQIPLE